MTNIVTTFISFDDDIDGRFASISWLEEIVFPVKRESKRYRRKLNEEII